MRFQVLQELSSVALAVPKEAVAFITRVHFECALYCSRTKAISRHTFATVDLLREKVNVFASCVVTSMSTASHVNLLLAIH